jgi:endonuclease I
MIRFRQIFTLFFLSLTGIILAQNPNGYYNTASGKKREQLKTSLHQIIRHHTVLDYGSMWVIFRQTDERPNSTVWDMYSSQVRTFNSTSGLNREHAFPKSWWGGDENPAYTDINHLYPSDAAANTAKSNHPLGVVGSNPSFNNGVSKVGSNVYPGFTGTVFEPDDEYKGDFARTYLYMVTRYQDFYNKWRYLYMLDANTYPVLKPWSINLLLEWHRNDPVSQKELERNEAVFRIQNNRNPFIDYPELVEYIWGSKMTETFTIDTSITKPVLTTPTNDTELQFGTVVLNQTGHLTLFVKGANLTGDLTVLLYGTNAAMFSINNISKISSALANSQQGYELSVTYTPTQISDSHSSTILIYDGGMDGSVIVNVHGSSITQEALNPTIALAATNVSSTGFTANWQELEGTDAYLLNIYSISNGTPELVRTEEDIHNTGTFIVTGLVTNQEYSYTVQREVKGLVTEHSNTIEVRTATSIGGNVRNNKLDVWTNESTIHIDNRSGIPETISIYNISGVLLFHSPELTGRTSFTTNQSGIYFIYAGGGVGKVVVRSSEF